MRYGRTWIWGFRRHEYWIGFRYSLGVDAWEFNLFGLTLYVTRETLSR